jgi:hypothetical protein
MRVEERERETKNVFRTLSYSCKSSTNEEIDVSWESAFDNNATPMSEIVVHLSE